MVKRLVVLVLLVVVVGGCSGQSGDDAAADEGATTAPAGEDAFEPVTVEHRYGETEITERPERIVTLDLQWTDVLVALDAPPVGYLVDPTSGEDLPWQEDHLGDAARITATTSVPQEQIVDLQPDLIVVTYLAEEEGIYEELSRIAPTISTLSDSQVDTWQDIAGVAGQILGEEERAADLVADVEGQVEAVAADLPGLDGKTFTFANYVPGDAMYVLSDPADGANVLFGQLGLAIAPAILDAEDDSPGRVKLSLENVDLLEADLVMVLGNEADAGDIPGYAELEAVERDAALLMDYDLAVALNTPSPLSLPYALDRLRPTLEAAAA